MQLDIDSFFDDDYLYFYQDLHSDERSDRQASLISDLLDLEPGMEVLDLACGQGRIANRIAESGCRVTGLDITRKFIDLAREDACHRGVEVEYINGDMRQLPWNARFNRVICWFTSFGYFDDSVNREVLRQVYASIRPGGRFLLHLLNRDRLVRHLRPDEVVSERSDDIMIDRSSIDILTSRLIVERIIVRSGKTRRIPCFMRLFTFTEIKDWLLDVGFTEVTVSDERGRDITLDSRCMIVIAER